MPAAGRAAAGKPLGELLAAAAEQLGDLPAVDDYTRPAGARETRAQANAARECARSPRAVRSYEELDRRVDALACGLAECGLRRGDRVGVVLPNCTELLELWLATARAGGVLVPLNPKLTRHERTRLLDHAGVSVLVAAPEHLDELSPLPSARTRVSVLGEIAGAIPIEALSSTKGQRPGVTVRARDAVAVLYTSGTSGRPKGCVISHDGLVVPAHTFRHLMQVTPEDRFFVCLPLFHMAGAAFATAAVAGGATVALVDHFSASRFWRQLVETRATVFRHLGEMLALLNERPWQPEESRHRLRAVYGGGARPDVIAAFERRFSVPVVEGYGLTETNTVLCNALGRRRAGSIGRPTPYSEVRIADQHGFERPVGEIGEIQVRRNPAMMRGYLAEPELTDASFDGDWLKTGDLGCRDAAGYFYYAGRCKDVVRRRGELVAAVEVEEVLNRHPAVRSSAVIPVRDALGGEEVKAVVVPCAKRRPAVSDVVAWCRRFLADFKVPRYVEFRDRLPYTATNKVDKALLRASSSSMRFGP